MSKEITNYLNEKIHGAKASFNEVERGSPSISLDRKFLKKCCLELRDSSEFQFTTLQVVSGVDYPEIIEVNYMLCSFLKNLNLILKIELEKPKEGLPEVDSLCEVWKSANFLEREVYDLIGVDFIGHPDMRRILCPYDWEGHPLRKDYEVQKTWQGFEVNPLAKINQSDFDFMARTKMEHENPKRITGSWGGHISADLSDALEKKMESLSDKKP